VFAGLLVGILLSRTLSGTVAHHFGWRSVYWLGAGLMVALGIVLAAVLPRHELAEGISYRQLLVSVVGLMKRDPVLRQAALNGALLFATFSAFWATLVFRLETRPFHYGERAAGLFGIVGAAGALAAPVVGRFADRLSPRSIVGWATGLLVVSYAIFWAVGETLAGLIVGVVLLDLAVQAAQVSNLTRVYAAAAGSAQSRANTAFMTCYFIGGSAGSLLGIWAWSLAGWTGVCVTGLVLSAAALLAHAAPALPRRGGAVSSLPS
jgi:predicted MFS family arabinose efflux permease